MPTFDGDPNKTTLEEAKQWLRDRFKDGANCPCCNQFVKLYKRKLNSGMAFTLIKIYQAFEAEPSTDWLDVTHYLRQRKIIAANSNTALLRHWGLLDRKTDSVRPDGSPRVGLYRITERGKRFVLGEIRVPRHIYLYNQTPIRREDTETISISEALGEKFNYNELMNSQ